MEHTKYRKDIDGLRAIAILSVVGFHAFPNWIKGGFVGVDIFFVISGYLISSIIFSNFAVGSFSFINFYSRRIKRIFPALISVLIFCLLAGWFLLFSTEYEMLAEHVASGAGFISNILLWHQSGYFDSAAESKPLLHLWSLAIESQFYIVYPLLVYFGWKFKLKLLPLLLLALACSFVLNVFMVKDQPVFTFYAPFTRF
jgi:peptidoglycan/LPS O-acetylase OafA/YrhL